jgi:hypothetical protein
MAAHITRWVEAAGKDASQRRTRLRQVVQLGADFYAALMRRLSGAAVTADEQIVAAASAAARCWTGDAVTAVGCLQRCLDAESQLLGNANLPTLVECWIDDLATLQSRLPARARL